MVASPAREQLLIVDDALDTLEVLQRNLSAQGYEVFRAQGVAEAIELLGRTRVDLVITDLKMPGATGLELVRHVREKLHDTEVMMITGYSSIEGAVEAVKLGAEEYLPKPFTQDELLVSVRRALVKLKRRRAQRPATARTASDLLGLVGGSEPMRRVFESVFLASGSAVPVLLSGAAGTGKEQVAREIHYLSDRARSPFVAVCCGKIPQELIQGELFGDEHGGAPGCVEQPPARGGAAARGGIFQLAAGGTLYLEEITELDLQLQEKIASAIAEKQIAGPDSSPPTSVRIIAGTTLDLPALVNKGRFREDLLLSLGAIVITLPELRERGADLALLAGHFLERAARRMGRAVPQLAPSALEALAAYPWPGNLAELRAAMERLILGSNRETIEISDLPHLVRSSLARADALNRSLDEVEAEHIRETLASVQGNKTRCSKILGIDRKTLREKMKAYDL